MNRTAGFLVSLVLACSLASGLALAQQPRVLPDSALTPGAVATTDVHGPDGICTRVNGLTYTKRHRVWNRQRETYAKYGIPSSERGWEDDDRVPVCLGGDNANPLNHWPQPPQRLVGDGNGYEDKDEMDGGACRLVCQGIVGVQEAQSWFLLPDWRDGLRAYRKSMAGHQR